MNCRAEISALLDLSARIGRDPLLTQASNGNTSIKLDGAMWIKASGKWLAHATEEETLVPLSLAELQWSLARNEELPGSTASGPGNSMRASIETAMHGVLPQRVVIHVHSVNTIAWAIRQDGEQRLAERLRGLNWQWIPYAPSGYPLARAIEKAITASPEANVFILANHGLVVCGEDCDSAEELLWKVESRLAVKARTGPECDAALPAEMDGIARWTLPEDPELHTLGTEAVSRNILKGGVLYPCQAIFLEKDVVVFPGSVPVHDAVRQVERQYAHPPFWIIEDRGIVVSRDMTKAQYVMLKGLLHVVQRIEESAPIRYFSEDELLFVLHQDAHGYRQCAEKNTVCQGR